MKFQPLESGFEISACITLDIAICLQPISLKQYINMFGLTASSGSIGIFFEFSVDMEMQYFCNILYE